MLVTKIEPVTNQKMKVFIEEQFAFVLYKGELLRYKITEGKEVSQEVILQIRTEVLTKRAKLRAMHLLEKMSRTEKQLYTKLKQDLYPEDIVEEAMQYVKSFGYIDDYKYAMHYIETKKNSKSMREIQAELGQRGIPREILFEALSQSKEEVDEMSAIQKLTEKKRFDPKTATEKEKKRMQDYLLRKGFSYEDVRQVIQVSYQNA